MITHFWAFLGVSALVIVTPGRDLLPQFATSFGSLLLLGLVFASLTLVWLTAYAFAVAKSGDFVRRSRVRRALHALTGAVLVGLGLRLAAESR